MRYRKPWYYDSFQCIAGECPDTCCAGWQILIDSESLEKYASVKGSFGTRLLNSIDWYQGAFEQYEKRCSFLNERNLCDLYQELGPGGLCRTCRMYPRHVEEFEELREYSLSLSCPEAARLMLSQERKIDFLVTEDDTPENEEDYLDFDLLLFDCLEEARELIFSMLQNRKLNLGKRMTAFLNFSYEIQRALDSGELFELDLEECLEKILKKEGKGNLSARFRNRKEMLKDLKKLELLREDWGKELENLQRALYDRGEKYYRGILEDFQEALAKNNKEESWAIWGEQILLFFVYTYFCGAVYDDRIYTKALLAVFSLVWIEETVVERYETQGAPLELETFCRAAWELAREIEHSDENMNLLEEIFEESQCYLPENFLPALLNE